MPTKEQMEFEARMEKEWEDHQKNGCEKHLNNSGEVCLMCGKEA